jgi:hypothetical protein
MEHLAAALVLAQVWLYPRNLKLGIAAGIASGLLWAWIGWETAVIGLIWLNLVLVGMHVWNWRKA